MTSELTARPARRLLSFGAGLGMASFAALTINHYFAANFPETIWAGSFCDISAFFNCDSSAFSPIAQLGGVPLGFFGLMVGGLVMLGAAFPSDPLERTNKAIALANGVGVVALFLYSVVVLRSLCLLCSGYYLFSLLSLGVFWRWGGGAERGGLSAAWAAPSLPHLAAFGLVTALGAYGFAEYHEARAAAQTGGVAAQVVEQ